MAGSKSLNIFSSVLLSWVAAATLIMCLSILTIVPKAQARDMTIFSDQAKCMTLLADAPGSKEYCTAFLEPLPPSPSPSDDMGQWSQDLEQCWSSLRSIQGCVGDIFFALFSGDFSKLQHDCCLAIESIAVDCWLKMFPWNPMFPTLLLNSCSHVLYVTQTESLLTDVNHSVSPKFTLMDGRFPLDELVRGKQAFVECKEGSDDDDDEDENDEDDDEDFSGKGEEEAAAEDDREANGAGGSDDGEDDEDEDGDEDDEEDGEEDEEEDAPQPPAKKKN